MRHLESPLSRNIRPSLRHKLPNLRHLSSDFRHLTPDFKLMRPGLRYMRHDLKLRILGMRPLMLGSRPLRSGLRSFRCRYYTYTMSTHLVAIGLVRSKGLMDCQITKHKNTRQSIDSFICRLATRHLATFF